MEVQTITDLERLIKWLEHNNIQYNIITVEKDRLDEHYMATGLKITALLINKRNDLLALSLEGLLSKTITNFCNEIFNRRSLDNPMFPHLKRLGFFHCMLEHLPKTINNISHIEGLDVYFCKLQCLPDWLQNFKNLKKLNLASFSDISDCLLKLTDLEELRISYMKMPLPDWLQELSHIKCLFLDGNGLTVVPEWLKKLSRLERLILYNNNLKSLPDWISGLPKLKSINIGSNPLETISSPLLDLSLKNVISPHGLSIADVPDEITKQGWKAIRQYYATQTDEIPLDEKGEILHTVTELKIMIIGAGNSGKSSISKAMANEKHDPKEKSTVGIALKNISHKFNDREQEWLFRIWDFGGQEAYAATQTLFMTPNTLYLVVADGRTENRPDPYLSYIETFAKDSPVILVINKIDENERVDINRHVYIENHKNLHPNMVRFSCVPGYSKKCTEDLYEEIERVLFGDIYGEQLQFQWRPDWRAVKNELIELLDKSKRYIDAKDFYRICEEKKISVDVGKTIRVACNSLGIIFSYEDPKAREPIDRILHPAWITKGINCLFELPGNGLFTSDDIHTHMQKRNYSKDETRSILEILETKDLAIWLQDNRQFFIPALLPNVLPLDFPKEYNEWEMDMAGKSNTCEIRYHYKFLHPSIKQKFMVKSLSSRSIKMSAYRYGAWWYIDNVRVVMMEETETEDLTFYLKSNDENALRSERNFIQKLMKAVHDNKVESTLMHVFRTKNGAIKSEAQYSNEDLWTLKEVMKVDKLPLPRINRVISVNEVLAGYENPRKEREYDMSGNTTINYNAPVTKVEKSTGTLIVGDVTESTVTTTVVQTPELDPEKVSFAKEANEAIEIIKTLQEFDQDQKEKLIEFMNEANEATQSDDEEKKKSCKEKFKAFMAGAGKAAYKAMTPLYALTKIAYLFGIGPFS